MVETSIQPPVLAGPSPGAISPAAAARPKPRRSWGRWLLACGLVVTIGGVGALYAFRSGKGGTNAQHGQRRGSGESHEAAPAVAVQVIRPHRGGMARTTEMPGTIRAFEFAPLYCQGLGLSQGAQRRSRRPGQEGAAPGAGLRSGSGCRRAPGEGLARPLPGNGQAGRGEGQDGRGGGQGGRGEANPGDRRPSSRR